MLAAVWISSWPPVADGTEQIHLKKKKKKNESIWALFVFGTGIIDDEELSRIYVTVESARRKA